MRYKTIYVSGDTDTLFNALKSLLSRERNYEQVTDDEVIQFLIKYYNDRQSN